jgi:hypothetical protein
MVFLIECIFKIIGLGIKNYFKDNYNLFDSVVVLISVVDFVLNQLVPAEDLDGATDVLQAVKCLRLLRVIKIARQWSSLQELLSKIGRSLADISMFSVLLFLMVYIMALLGMELFANYCRFDENENLVMDPIVATTKGTEMAPPRDNFDTIGNALTTVFILILGEDWPGIMYNYVRVYGYVSGKAVVLYFILTFCLGNLMLLSLFTAILLQNFEGGDDDEEDDPNAPI